MCGDCAIRKASTCELRDDSRAGAGWDAMMLHDGEPLLKRRALMSGDARYVAESFRQDTVRGTLGGVGEAEPIARWWLTVGFTVP